LELPDLNNTFVSLTDKSLAEDIAARLLQIQAIQLRPTDPFTWASGMRSPIYCDNRLLLSYPTHRAAVANGLKQLASTFGAIDAIAGVATAGIPHGALLADRMELPFVYVRDKAKSHGKNNQIEGKVTPRMRVLVVEDLISTGGSSLKAVEALRDADCEVVGLVAIFTYGFQAAVNNFEAAHCPFDTLTDYPTMLQVAMEQSYIESEQLSTLQNWQLDPPNWYKA
jgi:orotate phosphoribosyltransferase